MNRIGYKIIRQISVMFLGVGVAVTGLSTVAASVEQDDAASEKFSQATNSSLPGDAQGEPIFVIVNGKSVTVREFQGLLAETMRGRFYHGEIPENKVEELNREVSDLIINRELLTDEAGRRGIIPDPDKYNKALAKLDERYANVPEWVKQRDQMLPLIKTNMDRQSMVEQLEQIVRNVKPPTSAEVRAYYDKKPELFTEPERIDLSIILLKIDPSSNRQEWDRAREEASKIVRRIRDGADFAEQARIHSQHDSASNGGSLGYLHGGMMPRGLEEKTDQLKVGEVNDPITTLEGIVVARLDERIPAKLREFVKVQDRARDLLIRNRADNAWKALKSQLRSNATIKIVTPQLPGAS